MAWGCIVILEYNDKGTDDGVSLPSPVIRPIDFGAAPNHVLYAIMKAIASGICLTKDSCIVRYVSWKAMEVDYSTIERK